MNIIPVLGRKVLLGNLRFLPAVRTPHHQLLIIRERPHAVNLPIMLPETKLPKHCLPNTLLYSDFSTTNWSVSRERGTLDVIIEKVLPANSIKPPVVASLT